MFLKNNFGIKNPRIGCTINLVTYFQAVEKISIERAIWKIV